jgi:hypothetical protein
VRRIAPLPAQQTAAGLLQHPPVERDDQSGFLSHIEKFGGQQQAAFGMLPAHQGFAAADDAAAQINNGLIEDLEFAALQGMEQALDTGLAVRRDSAANAVA